MNGGYGEVGDGRDGRKVFFSNKDKKSPLWVRITHATGLVCIHSILPDQTKQNQYKYHFSPPPSHSTFFCLLHTQSFSFTPINTTLSYQHADQVPFHRL